MLLFVIMLLVCNTMIAEENFDNLTYGKFSPLKRDECGIAFCVLI